MADVLLVERHGRVTVLRLNRPDRLNAVDEETLHVLAVAVDDIEADEEVGAFVVTGVGKAFSAGADITGLGHLKGAQDFSAFIKLFSDTLARVQRSPKPSVAAINGMALGGGLELALACDLRVATAGVRLGVPEIKLGLLPGAGGTARLPRLLPKPVAKQLLLTGDPLAADEAHRLGLVNEVVGAGGGDVVDVALELATRVAAMPALALAAAKRLVDEGGEMPLAAAVTFERETVSMLFGTEDRGEGIAAFLEKRPPKFRGR